jgi:peptide methionine sulfoxide reductase MsrA
VTIFAGGCFCYTEAVFLELKGVNSVVPGYIGGKNVDPSYKEICGRTGHAERSKLLSLMKYHLGIVRSVFCNT